MFCFLGYRKQSGWPGLAEINSNINVQEFNLFSGTWFHHTSFAEGMTLLKEVRHRHKHLQDRGFGEIWSEQKNIKTVVNSQANINK